MQQVNRYFFLPYSLDRLLRLGSPLHFSACRLPPRHRVEFPARGCRANQESSLSFFIFFYYQLLFLNHLHDGRYVRFHDGHEREIPV